jgi:Ca-activated chloride channel family protein
MVAEVRRGRDIVLAFDLSRSMDLVDAGSTSASRLRRAAGIAQDFLDSQDFNQVRAAAAIGGGTGFLAVPLTSDAFALEAFIDSVTSRSITSAGTNLEKLIYAAAAAFQDSFPTSRDIILFSDGESLDGSLENAAIRCSTGRITLWTVGVGSEAGQIVSPSSFSDAGVTGKTPPQTGGNDSVRSFLHAAELKAAAQAGGGEYVDGNREDAAEILTGLLEGGGGPVETVWRAEDKPLSHLFIVGALVCFLASKLCEIKRRRGRRGRAALSLLAVMLTLSSCGASFTDVRGKLKLVEGVFFMDRGMNVDAISAFLDAGENADTAPYAEFALGSVYLGMDELDSALARFESAGSLRGSADRGEFSYRLYYNSGVAYFNVGNFEEAQRCFKRALAADPRRIDAKRNLELSQLSLTRKAGVTQEAQVKTMRDAASSSRAGRGALMDFFRQKEQDNWKSWEWTDGGGTGLADY